VNRIVLSTLAMRASEMFTAASVMNGVSEWLERP
jgi:hypothetical protein